MATADQGATGTSGEPEDRALTLFQLGSDAPELSDLVELAFQVVSVSAR